MDEGQKVYKKRISFDVHQVPVCGHMSFVCENAPPKKALLLRQNFVDEIGQFYKLRNGELLRTEGCKLRVEN